MDREINRIADWLSRYVYDSGAKGIVLGISGGVDSSVMAAISKLACGDDVLGLKMPINSIPEDELYADILARTINLKTERIDLTGAYEAIKSVMADSEKILADSNIKPRLRMTCLYYYAQINNYLVVGSSNFSEAYVGYFTKHGDSGVDLLPLLEYKKNEIYNMARELGLPEIIINRAPTAGLYDGQTDESELGFNYDTLDTYLNKGLIDLNTQMRISRMHKSTEHKRAFPVHFKR